MRLRQRRWVLQVVLHSQQDYRQAPTLAHPTRLRLHCSALFSPLADPRPREMSVIYMKSIILQNE